MTMPSKGFAAGYRWVMASHPLIGFEDVVNID